MEPLDTFSEAEKVVTKRHPGGIYIPYSMEPTPAQLEKIPESMRGTSVQSMQGLIQGQLLPRNLNSATSMVSSLSEELQEKVEATSHWRVWYLGFNVKIPLKEFLQNEASKPHFARKYKRTNQLIMNKLLGINNNDEMEVDDEDDITPQPPPARKSMPRDAKKTVSYKSTVVTPLPPPLYKKDVDQFLDTVPQFQDVNNRKSKKRSASTAMNLITKFAKTTRDQLGIIDDMRKTVMEEVNYKASTIASSPLVSGVVDCARELLSGTIGRGAVEILGDCEERRKKGGRPTRGEDEVKFMSVMFFVRGEMNSMDWGPGAARLMEKKVMKQLPRLL